MSENIVVFKAAALEKEVFSFKLKLKTASDLPIAGAKVTSDFKGKVFESETNDDGEVMVKAFPSEIASLKIEKKGIKVDEQFFELVDLSFYTLTDKFFSVKLVDENMNPIENALIELQGFGGVIEGITSEKGLFLGDIPFKSSFLVKINKDGYESFQQFWPFSPRLDEDFMHAVPVVILKLNA